MKKTSFKQRFSYWFDNQMSRGMSSLVKLLVMFTLTVGITVALLLFFLNLTSETSFAAVLWKSLITVLRSSFPGFHDGGPLYLQILTARAAYIYRSRVTGKAEPAFLRRMLNDYRLAHGKELS